MHAFVGHRTPTQTHSLGHIKPQGLDVHQAFDPALFRSGAVVLYANESPLEAPVMAALHCLSCHVYTAFHGGLSASCYFAQMLRCVTHGWSPRVSLPIQALHATKGNYPALSRFHESARDEFHKMSRHGVVRPVVNPRYIRVSLRWRHSFRNQRCISRTAQRPWNFKYRTRTARLDRQHFDRRRSRH